MSYRRQIVAQLARLGREANVLTRSETGTNEFGNTTDDHTFDRTVIAAQTYPNRNTDVESGLGDRSQDRPVFMVPNTDDQPAPPQEGDYLNYNGQNYEVKAHTRYDTHVEFFGEPIIYDESGE